MQNLSWRMIKFNDQFSIEGEPNNWILHETRVGKDGEGNQKLHTKKSYHGSLKQIATAIIDRLAATGNYKQIEELLTVIQKTELKLTKWLEELAAQPPEQKYE